MEVRPLPSSFIGSDLINKRSERFKQEVQARNSPDLILSNGEDNGETKWVWYSKLQVIEWLEEMDALNADGIRIYFGQKEEHESDAKPLEVHEPRPGQLCLMIVLTKISPTNPEVHDNIVYEHLPDYGVRKAKTDSEKDKNLNAGSYSPPLKYRFENDYPNDSLTLPA